MYYLITRISILKILLLAPAANHKDDQTGQRRNYAGKECQQGKSYCGRFCHADFRPCEEENEQSFTDADACNRYRQQ